MTKEELEKEAYQYDADHLRDNGTRWYHNVTVREAYLAGAEPREKRIADLEAQIEEMKKERSAEVKQRVINEIVSAIEKDREEGR